MTSAQKALRNFFPQGQSKPAVRPQLHEGETKCGHCGGTGQYVTRVENGQPKGPGGDCFRCAGKGYQTEADRRRNWGYDSFHRKLR